ncbi:phospholysine phosphohistidine inorganic pyrophosphate phosphatase isoform X2 [Diceros bicornis minor]|uniref:phospholysine phosphohistidine inorganic pyrophosphate phosphatase isoform X2 n=1 Tax=Diceros bicornis minor TaxID=77932 RepID=UPI0026EC444B|nr:phospholysine phosphohistidine inorganic pyrophosphate phosphatase isoform X2 [Diceros bicornis minor]
MSPAPSLPESPLTGTCWGPVTTVLVTISLPRLKRSRLKVRFCTNESQKSLEYLVGLLRGLGFDISEGDVTAPAPATCLILKERGLRPHLLISDGIRSEFDQIDTSNPNCVVMADAGEGFSYQNMNKAFQVLMELENPVLISLGKGRYYKETSGLMLDIGAYVKALEYACGIEAEVVGKPSPEFFKSALREMGVEAHQKHGSCQACKIGRLVSFPRNFLARWPPEPLAAMDRVLSRNAVNVQVSGLLLEKGKVDSHAGAYRWPSRLGQAPTISSQGSCVDTQGTLASQAPIESPVCAAGSAAGPTSGNTRNHWLFLL